MASIKIKKVKLIFDVITFRNCTLLGPDLHSMRWIFSWFSQFTTPHPTSSLLLGAPSLYALSGPTSNISVFCTVLTLLYDWGPSLGGCLCQGLFGCEKLKPLQWIRAVENSHLCTAESRNWSPAFCGTETGPGGHLQQETFNSPPSVFLWGCMCMSPCSRASFCLQRIHSACLQNSAHLALSPRQRPLHLMLLTWQV